MKNWTDSVRTRRNVWSMRRDKYAQLHYATRIGREEGAKQINELNKRLIELGRIDDLKRTVEDSDYQEQLLKEMKIIARYD